MKRALIYSCIFHILLFIFINILQQYKPEEALTQSVSITIIPVESPKPSTRIIPATKPHKSLERLPPIKESRQPKYLSATPKGKQASPSESITTEKEFTKMTPAKQSPDIFDKDVIAKLSRKQMENRELKPSHGLSFSTKEFNDWGYLERLKEKIERIWQYPLQAAEKGIYGDLYLRFTIDKKGKLVSVELLRTSGYRILDDAAIKALKDAQPFWPLPDDWGKDSLTITGHFIYTLHGFYLR